MFAITLCIGALLGIVAITGVVLLLGGRLRGG